MGHAEHFLERLDRLNTSQVDLALQLYRDPDLLRAIMAAAKVPEALPRIAISLDDPELGPFIIVTRGGDFVTCLGKGMQVSDLRVISRSHLNALSEKIETLRERMALAMKLVGNHRGRPCTRLMRRLLVESDSVGREEWLAVSAWEPFLSPAFIALYLDMAKEILVQQSILSTRQYTKSKAEQALHDHWNLVHAAGHFILLATMGGDREQLQRVFCQSLSSRVVLSWPLISTGTMPLIMKGAWAAGRVGRDLLVQYKKELARELIDLSLLDTVFSLIAVARRTSAVRSEVTKAFRATTGIIYNPGFHGDAATLGQVVKLLNQASAVLIEADSENLEQNLVDVGRSLLPLIKDSKQLAEALGPQGLRILPSQFHQDGLCKSDNVFLTLQLVAAIARDAPEQFYLPREIARQWRPHWTPESTLRLLDPTRPSAKMLRAPVVRTPTPGPNQPCSCGSGRKYKKCCSGKCAKKPENGAG